MTCFEQEAPPQKGWCLERGYVLAGSATLSGSQVQPQGLKHTLFIPVSEEAVRKLSFSRVADLQCPHPFLKHLFLVPLSSFLLHLNQYSLFNSKSLYETSSLNKQFEGKQSGTSLVVQWLRVHPAMRGMQG